jgi:hypothetical protein
VSQPIIPAMQAAATPLKLEFDIVEVQGPGEFDSAFASMAVRFGAGARPVHPILRHRRPEFAVMHNSRFSMW